MTLNGVLFGFILYFLIEYFLLFWLMVLFIIKFLEIIVFFEILRLVVEAGNVGVLLLIFNKFIIIWIFLK